MTKQEIKQFPKSASEYLHKQKDLTYQQEVHQFFEVIKYYRKELKDANRKIVYMAGRQPKDLIYQNKQLKLQLGWVKGKIKKVLELPPISNERLEILKELEKFVKECK